jgi:hypothetical protein
MKAWVDEALQFRELWFQMQVIRKMRSIKRVKTRIFLMIRRAPVEMKGLLVLMSIKSSTVISSLLMGSLPLSAMYFSIKFFSKTFPDFNETTGCLGASPETIVILLIFRIYYCNCQVVVLTSTKHI